MKDYKMKTKTVEEFEIEFPNAKNYNRDTQCMVLQQELDAACVYFDHNSNCFHIYEEPGDAFPELMDQLDAKWTKRKKKFRVNFELDSWVRFLDIEADSAEEAKEILNTKMSFKEIIEEGYVADFEIKDLDIEEIDPE